MYQDFLSNAERRTLFTGSQKDGRGTFLSSPFHWIYDPDTMKFSSNDMLIKEKLYRLSKNSGSFEYTELHIEFWVFAVLVGIVLVNVKFFLSEDMHMQEAMLWIYLYVTLLFLLSNGILLNPIDMMMGKGDGRDSDYQEDKKGDI